MSTAVKMKPGPLYERVKQHIVERITSGEWTDGTRLPSEHELVEALGVSRMTVHRALRELSSDGLLSRIQGVGTFVATPKAKSALIEIQDIAEDIVARGHAHRAKLVALEAIRADAELAASFDLRPGAKIFHSLIVHYEDEMPIQLEERFVTPFFAPHYLEQDFTRLTTTPYLQNISPPTEVEHVIHAVKPDARVQDLLAVGPDEPCLMLLRRTWTAAGPATKNIFIYPGDRYSLGSRYKVT